MIFFDDFRTSFLENFEICKKSADCYVIYGLRGFFFIGNICEMMKIDEIDAKL